VGLLPNREIAAMLDTLNLVANARLTRIQDPPAMDASGDPTGNGPQLWAGAVLGYLDRERILAETNARPRASEFLAGGLEQVTDTDTFTILDAGGAPLLERAGPEWKGTTVTIEDLRTTPSTTWTWRVKGMRHDAYGTLDSITLELSDPTKIA
jgi:hypothetical protein